MSDTEIYRKIAQYIDGELQEHEIENLWEKFVDNPEYYKWFETELHLRDLAKEASKKNLTSITSVNGISSNNQPNSIRNWFFAVAAIILVGIGFQLFTMQDSVSVHPYSISQIEIDEMSGSDIMRSDEMSASMFDVEMSRALTLAYEEKYEESGEKFRSLLIQSPDSEQEARILMNLGILHYNMGEFEVSKGYFESAAKSDEMNKFFREKAWWFLGNTYLNLELLEDARDAVYHVHSADGRFAGQAEGLLQKLNKEIEKKSD